MIYVKLQMIMCLLIGIGIGVMFGVLLSELVRSARP